ncbi:hypothetical protein Mapa_012060 [Marchantia paleacea]|nr:hypothetical protein Mapa_012060 [Marchantia paleacea]
MYRRKKAVSRTRCESNSWSLIQSHKRACREDFKHVRGYGVACTDILDIEEKPGL